MTTPANAIRSGLLAILATTTLAGCGPGPGTSPTVSPTASAAPTASVAPTPVVAAFTGGVAPGEVTIDPTLPDALPLPNGIWEQTEPGWVLAMYLPYYEHRDEFVVQNEEPESAKFVIYLVSPEGQRYQVLRLDRQRSISIESWTAGETHAVVRESTGTDGGVLEVLDLKTGDTWPHETPSAWVEVRFNTPDSVRVWSDQYGNQGYIERDGEFIPLAEGWLPPWRAPLAPSPDGKWIAVLGPGVEGGSGHPVPIGAARLSTGEVTSFPDLDALGSCALRGWADSGSLLVSCSPEGPDPDQYFEAEPSTGTVTESDYVAPADDPIGLYHDFWMSPDVWVGNAGMEPGTPFFGVGVEDHGAVRELLIVDEQGNRLLGPGLVAVVDGVLYVEEAPGALPVVVAYDLATDRQIVLLACPPAPSDFDPDSFISASMSWVVAP